MVSLKGKVWIWPGKLLKRLQVMEHNQAYCTPWETIRQYSLSSTLVVGKGPEKPRKKWGNTSEMEVLVIIIMCSHNINKCSTRTNNKMVNIRVWTKWSNIVWTFPITQMHKNPTEERIIPHRLLELHVQICCKAYEQRKKFCIRIVSKNFRRSIS